MGMRKLTVAGAVLVGIAVGGVLFNAVPSYADLPVVDVGVETAVEAVKSVLDTVNKYIQDINTALGTNKFGSVQQLLQEGFTQISNYQKAQVGALQQLFDASNTAMARFDRDIRNAQMRDEQTPSAAACAALDGGVSTQAAAV
jgi:hypothetical protein